MNNIMEKCKKCGNNAYLDECFIDLGNFFDDYFYFVSCENSNCDNQTDSYINNSDKAIEEWNKYNGQ